MTGEANRKALEEIRFCLDTIKSPIFSGEENCIWSSGTFESPRITETTLKTALAALSAPQAAGVETQDAEIVCKSCNEKYAMPATHYAHPVDADGNVIPALDNWPLCQSHVMHGVLAGWKPTPIPAPVPRLSEQDAPTVEAKPIDMKKIMDMADDMEVIAKFTGEKGRFVGDVAHVAISDLARSIRKAALQNAASQGGENAE